MSEHYQISYNPIGIIETPFKNLEGMPIQPIGAKNVKGKILMKDEYRDGLKDLDGFSHIILIYHLHLSKGYNLHVKPFLDNEERGIFATRAPKRPNQIGMSVVCLDSIEGTNLFISSVDIVDGTPLLDIKPYIPQFDKCKGDDVRIGWFEDKHEVANNKKSDDRFVS